MIPIHTLSFKRDTGKLLAWQWAQSWWTAACAQTVTASAGAGPSLSQQQVWDIDTLTLNVSQGNWGPDKMLVQPFPLVVIPIQPLTFIRDTVELRLPARGWAQSWWTAARKGLSGRRSITNYHSSESEILTLWHWCQLRKLETRQNVVVIPILRPYTIRNCAGSSIPGSTLTVRESAKLINGTQSQSNFYQFITHHHNSESLTSDHKTYT